MKILIATGIFPPDIGGPATYSKLLLDKLSERGFEVVVANFGDVRKFPKIIRHTVYFFNVLWLAWGADVVYAQDPVSVGLPAMLASKILRKKFYLKIVGDYAWEQGVQRFGVKDDLDTFSKKFSQYSFPVRLLKRIERCVALSAHTIVVPSEYLKTIVANWGVPSEKITVIYNGFKAPVIVEDKEMLRKKLGISGYALLSVGRLVPWKGFLLFVDWMPEILKIIPDAHLYIVGTGPAETLLRSKIKKNNLEKRVTLLGALPQEKLFEYIKASDVFVLNTAYEGFSHQLLEVMALGTPVVTTDVGGNREIIENGVSGFLVEHNARDSFLGRITLLRSDSGLVEKITANAKERVAQFSDEHMLSKISALLAQK